jgi:hypothetical protein
MFVAAAAASGEIGIGRDEETEGRPWVCVLFFFCQDVGQGLIYM